MAEDHLRTVADACERFGYGHRRPGWMTRDDD
jgi:hypothetical protein